MVAVTAAAARLYNRRWAREHAAHRREYSLGWRYNFTPLDYAEMLLAQQGVCGSCGQPETRRQNDKFTALAVDHDHKTGLVRGLLCSRCNLALGFLDDNTAKIRKLLAYMEREK